MRKISAFFILSLFLLFACNSTTNEPKEAADTAIVQESQGPKKVSNMEPGLFNADSLQIVYYDNPDGDSLRYTRFFTLTETADAEQIKALLDEMNQRYVPESKGRPCRSEGKLFLLKGEDVLKTVYFSTRGDSCTYFYFIKDGSFIYFPLTKAADVILKEYKKRAPKPKGDFNT
jgi:hypothetical protein